MPVVSPSAASLDLLPLPVSSHTDSPILLVSAEESFERFPSLPLFVEYRDLPQRPSPPSSPLGQRTGWMSCTDIGFYVVLMIDPTA